MHQKDYPEDFPSKNQKRGERKAKFSKCKHKAAKLAELFNIPEEFKPDWIVRHAESLNCNCWMCKNPRRVFKGKAKLTIQERRNFQKEE